jgi:hypothetical protein
MRVGVAAHAPTALRKTDAWRTIAHKPWRMTARRAGCALRHAGAWLRHAPLPRGCAHRWMYSDGGREQPFA